MPMQYGSNGLNSDGSLMNVGNSIWDPATGGRPSIRLYPEYSSGDACRSLLTDEAMGYSPPQPHTSPRPAPSPPTRRQPSQHSIQRSQRAFDQDIDRMRFEEATVMLRDYFNGCEGGLKAAFDSCDANGDKSLDASEVQQLLSKLGCELAFEEACDLVQMYDTNDDGLLQYFEVVRMLSHDGLPTERSKFRQSDPLPARSYRQNSDGLRHSEPTSAPRIRQVRSSNSQLQSSISPYSSPRSNVRPKRGLNDLQRHMLREVNAIVYQQMHSLLDAFQQMDRDGSKLVTVQQFVRLLGKYDLDISEKDAWRLFKLVLEPGDDALNYSKFVKLLAVGNQ